MQGRRPGRRWAVVLVVGLLAPFLVSAAPARRPAGGATEAACGAKDLPETATAGDVPLADQLSGRADHGYNCGLALVGYSSLGRRGGNANMAWSGDCAYIAGDGVAIVDVHDPTHPRQVGTLHSGGRRRVDRDHQRHRRARAVAAGHRQVRPRRRHR